MNENKRIVIEHYPVEKLPEELRAGLSGAQTVRVTVEPEIEREVAPPRLTRFFGAGRGAYPAASDVVSEIRKLRDEWE